MSVYIKISITPNVSFSRLPFCTVTIFYVSQTIIFMIIKRCQQIFQVMMQRQLIRPWNFSEHIHVAVDWVAGWWMLMMWMNSSSFHQQCFFYKKICEKQFDKWLHSTWLQKLQSKAMFLNLGNLKMYGFNSLNSPASMHLYVAKVEKYWIILLNMKQPSKI